MIRLPGLRAPLNRGHLVVALNRLGLRRAPTEAPVGKQQPASAAPPRSAPTKQPASASDAPITMREARRFVEFVHARYKTGGSLISKIEAKNIGRACGVRVPEDYAEFDSLESITHLDFLPPFVFKATHLSSKNGVYLITNARNGRFHDQFREKWMTLREIKEDLAEVLSLHRNPGRNRFIAEEFIRGANRGVIPIDYKMYTIGGEPLFILQVDRNYTPNAMAFFGAGMVPLSPGREVYTAEREIQVGIPEVPANWREMLDVARRITTHLKTPFVSVDVYTDGKDVILGELTTVPGGPYYGGTMFRLMPEFDRHLGDAWRRANDRLGIPIPTIKDDPPCFKLEAEILSGRLEASLRNEIKMLREELRKAKQASRPQD